MLLPKEPAWPDQSGQPVRYPPAGTSLPIGALLQGAPRFFAAEVRSIEGKADLERVERAGGIEPFRGLRTLQAHQGTSETELVAAIQELRSEDGFVLSLVQAYLTDAELADHAKTSSEAQLAVLSELVFEVEGAAPKELSQTLSAGGQTLTVELRWPRKFVTRTVRVVAEQRSTGVYFSWGRDFDASAALKDSGPSAEGARVRLRRSIGAYPDPAMPILREFIGMSLPPGTKDLSESNLIAIDSLHPTDHVGEVLHYQVELCDAHNQVLARGGVSLRRERLDPPLPPDSVEATLEVRAVDGKRTLTLKPSWSQAEKGGRDLFVEVYAEERELDECGFYGGDDDLALLEAAREADIDASAEGNVTIQDTFNRVAAENDRRGLLRVDEIPAARLAAGESAVLNSLDWMRPEKGYRLYVGVRRRVHTPGVTSASALVACRHELALQPSSGDRKELNVFQFERFDRAAPPKLLRASAVAAKADDAARLVQLTWIHERPAEGEAPIGGYCLYRRDILGPADPAPFDEAAVIEALPPLVAQYQPVHFEASAPLRFRFPLSSPLSAKPADLGAAEKALAAAVKALCDKLQGRERVPARPDKPSSGADYIKSAVPSDPATPYDWAVIGRLSQVLAEAGLARDVVVRAGGAQDLARSLAEELKNNAHYGSIKVLLPHTRDGVVLRTFRVLVVPPAAWQRDNLSADTPAVRACRRFLACPGDTTVPNETALLAAAPRLEVLHDASVSPVRLTIGPSRNLIYTDESVRDDWHHDLEWRVEKLDRYHHVREILHPKEERVRPVAPERDDKTISVSVLRMQPVSEAPVVLAALTRGEATVAFHVTDTRERVAASANALARTRAGRLLLPVAFSQQLPKRDREAITAALGTWSPKDQQKAIDDWIAAFSEKDDAPRPAERLIVLDPEQPDDSRVHPLCGAAWDVLAQMYPPPGDSAHETAPLPGTDRVAAPLAPYYVEHTLTAWIMADQQSSARASATARRAPRQIGLTRRPRFSVGADGRALTIRILPSLLGTHLSKEEHSALPSDRPALADFDVGGDVGAWPLEMIPDVWTEYILYCNAGTLDQVRAVEIGVVTRPPQGAAATALGFLFRSGPGAISAKPLAFRSGVLEVECQLAGDLPAITEKDKKTLSSRLFVKIRRGRATSDLIALMPSG